ncbi:MAG: anaerobic glycerol-3-phosphate dehydrogenase subunit GlpA [Desulfobacteraceae bacterium]|jgi:glycerol-3-phosphate dehydrogenase
METEVLIIGGGATGAGIARDLSLRGVSCILVEQGDFNNGATGANHGLLHSGARYAAKDCEAASECRTESDILKRLAPHCIENTKGLFAAVEGDDEEYAESFPVMCSKAGISAQRLSVEEAREIEPNLSESIISVFQVEDASIDPFRLTLDNINDAVENGARVFRFTEVEGFAKDGKTIKSVFLRDRKTGSVFEIEAEQYINASGAWAGKLASLAGGYIPMVYSKGTLLVTSSRINKRVINRLRPPGDADILVPGGTVSIIGTTSVEIKDLSDIRPTPAEVDFIISEGMKMVPALQDTRYVRAYAGVRPLVCSGPETGRKISRNYTLMDHEEQGLENFITITGGKLTTFRLMAEKTCDLVCQRLKNSSPCLTSEVPLPESKDSSWTMPGKSSQFLISSGSSDDTVLCECEMVTKSMVDSVVKEIIKEGRVPGLKEIGLRTRIGKGSCQGCFCSFRTAAYLYDSGVLKNAAGINEIKEFINERWKGVMPLARGRELMQAELQEAYMCSLFGFEN